MPVIRESYLVADIGGTNARFRLANAEGWLSEPVVLASAAFGSGEDLLLAGMHATGASGANGALLALAGPRDADGAVRLTNLPLRFDPLVCQERIGMPVRLVNDFFALAHGVPFFQDIVQVGGAHPATGTRAVIGPGSGLGMAVLTPGPGDVGWHVLPSEGGNADLAPGSHLEMELWGALIAVHQHVSWETVVSGPGLVRLYEAMCGVWGARPQTLTPQEISSQGMSMADPVCHQTLETWFALLGSAAGNLALTVNAFGGVYIAGDLVRQLLDFVGTSGLRRRFEERGALSPIMQQVPLYIITEADAGLAGARYCALSSV